MKVAVLYGKQDMRIEERPVPAIGPGEVLVRVSACGICGSDIRTYMRGPDPRYHPPVVLGHEFVGTVAGVGSGVHDFRRGDRVAAMPIFCGTCFHCRRGEENLCDDAADYGRNLDGAYAQYVRIPAHAVALGLSKVPPRLSDEEAALAEPVACCLHGFTRSALRPGETMVIFGDGPIGIVHTLLARHHGAGQVIVAGQDARRLAMAQSAGATHTFDVREDGLRDLVMESTGGRGADVVMAAAPSAAAIEQGASLLRKAGSLVVFGGCPPGSSFCLDPNRVHYNEFTLTGSFNCTRGEFDRALDIIPELGAKVIISQRVPLADVVSGMEAAARLEEMKVVIVVDHDTLQ